jgi:hypothetical protein
MADVHTETADAGGTWECIGEFARKRALRYRAYRNRDRTQAAILRVWPDPESDKTVVASRNEAGDLVFDFPMDTPESGEPVPWPETDRETAERAIKALIGRPANPISTGAARVCLEL